MSPPTSRPATVVALMALLLVASPQAAAAQAGAPPGRPPAGSWAGPPELPDAPEGAAGANGMGRMQRRMRLARSLGLAEALDLDEAEAARMNGVMAGFDARRKVYVDRIRADMRVLKQSARGGTPAAAPAGSQVEGAIQDLFAAREGLVKLDQEMFQALAQGLSPEKQARMALFFARFRQQLGMEILERRR